MGFKEFLQNWNEKKKREKEEFRRMERSLRFKKRLEEKQKTPAQKEYEFYLKEKQREELNKAVKIARKQREEKMKRLSDPFNKQQLFKANNCLMRGGMKWA